MPKVKQYERPNMVLAANIAKYKALTGLEVKDFEKVFNATRRTAYRKFEEKNLDRLELRELRGIARKFGISLQELLEGVK